MYERLPSTYFIDTCGIYMIKYIIKNTGIVNTFKSSAKKLDPINVMIMKKIERQ